MASKGPCGPGQPQSRSITYCLYPLLVGALLFSLRVFVAGALSQGYVCQARFTQSGVSMAITAISSNWQTFSGPPRRLEAVMLAVYPDECLVGFRPDSPHESQNQCAPKAEGGSTGSLGPAFTPFSAVPDVHLRTSPLAPLGGWKDMPAMF